MSDPRAPEPWWGDESPVGTEHRRLNGRHDDVGDADSAFLNGAGDRDGDLPLRNGAADRAVPAFRTGADGHDGDVPGRNGAGDHGLGHPGRSGDELPYRDNSAHADGPRRPPGPTRSSAKVFVPAPEDLPPFEEVLDAVYGGAPPAVPEPARVPDPPAWPAEAAGPPPAGPADPPPAPDLSRPTRSRGGVTPPARPRRQPIDRRRLATVYDIEGPRIRLGVAWFLGAMAATLASPFTAAIVFAVAAGLAARQIVRAWGSVAWQADAAAGLGAVPVLAALIGTPGVVVAVVLALVVAIGAACAPDGSRLPGGEGRVAAMGILFLSVVPGIAGAAFVLVRAESVVAAGVLLLIASAYEVGDYIVGSGASNPVEGPLAGITTASLVSLPLALVLVEPYDAAGVGLLAFAALACPLGQVVGSAVLPGAGAPAPALRRIDTLLVLAPLWAAAAGAF